MFVPSMHLNVHTYIYMPIDMPMLTHNAHLCVYPYKCASILWLMPRAAQGRPWTSLGRPWAALDSKGAQGCPKHAQGCLMDAHVLLRFDVEPDLMLWVHWSLLKPRERAG